MVLGTLTFYVSRVTSTDPFLSNPCAMEKLPPIGTGNRSHPLADRP